MKNHLFTKNVLLPLVGAVGIFFSCQKNTVPNDQIASPKGTRVYTDNWENIGQHYTCPDWYKDAKFGIFIHWGVYSVPAFGNEWYPRNMYIKDSPEYQHHRETFGPQDQFGYKDFIPMFKAEKFDAEEWASIFEASGAKYVIPVAEHHDGFAMYDSELNEWNAAKMGPKKDIIGLLKNSIEKRNLIFGVSSHRAENAWYFGGGTEFPSDVQDTTIALYGFRIPKAEQYTEAVGPQWLDRTEELLTKYQPQLIFFDWTVNNELLVPSFNKFLAFYYNSAIDWNKEVVVNVKFGYNDTIIVRDIERGKSDEMRSYNWQTDTSIGKKSWGYIDGEENKTPAQIVHDLVDIVSKGGNMLLNIGPRPDGTIPEEQKEVLYAIGDWMKINGEAIYGTRCWKVFGEGATKGTSGAFTDNEATEYTSEDMRFTTKDGNLYAILLNWDKKITIKSLATTNSDIKVKSVSLLGAEEALTWTQTDKGLEVELPSEAPCDFAYTLKITTE